MGRIAFVFSGQGDQYAGMGKDLYDNYKYAAEIFDMCESLRPGILQMCFEGSEEELKETKNTQSCLFAMELAAAYTLISEGVEPEALAGFSLGEVTAATVAGIFDKKTGFELVCKRGALMQEASLKTDASMAAVVKLSAEEVIELSRKYENVYPVNFNCPGQVTVSGLSEQMTDFATAVKEAGGRALPLKVKGGFHSPFMKEAAVSFEECIRKADPRPMKIKLYSNMTARPYSENVVELLSKQICNPVKWQESVENMIKDGIDTFIEIGPGRTLTNMIKKINPAVKACTVYEALEEIKTC